MGYGLRDEEGEDSDSGEEKSHGDEKMNITDDDIWLYCVRIWNREQKGKGMHKKIMERASKALKKDAARYSEKAKDAKTKVKAKHEKVEEKEARSAAREMKKRASSAHEY